MSGEGALGQLASILPEPLRELSRRIEAILYAAGPGEARPPLFISESAEAITGFSTAALMAEPELLLAHLHPGDVAQVRAQLRAFTGAEHLTLKFRAVARDGHLLFFRETMVASLGGLAGVLVDVSELEAPQRALEAALLAEGPREAMLCFCTALAQSFALGRTGYLDARSGRLVVASHGPLGVRLDLAEEGAHAGSPFARLGEQALRRGELCFSPRGNSFALPLQLDGGAPGALLGSADAPLQLVPYRKRTLLALGASAAHALRRAELLLELRRTSEERRRLAAALVGAHEAERAHLARELHDGAGQTLTAAIIQLDLAAQAPPAEWPAAVARARAQVEATLTDLRRLSHALRPAALDRLGLPEALQEMARALCGPRLAVEAELDPQLPRIDGQLATAIFRIAQEALTNAVRHAQASRATVRLTAGRSELVLEILDDGRGGKDLAAGAAGLGLLAMRERAAALGGQLSLQSREGGGTCVRATLPLPR